MGLMTSMTLFRTRRFDVRVILPAVGRKRLICAGSMASTATTLWLAVPACLPGADVSAVMVLAGFGIPWSVAWVTLLLMERRILRDLAADPNRGQDWAVPR
jgi:hypothetical protein